jgi:hypothetical protein
MIYIDDSGHHAAGLAVYGWIEFPPDHWSTVLRCWLDNRKMLWREFGVAVPTELHTTNYVNGRGRISKRIPDRHIHDGVEFHKDFGREVAETCLETIRCTEGLRVGAVYRRGDPNQIAKTRSDTYRSLVARFESELAGTESHALLFMDGDGSDLSYRTAHRELRLNERRVIEDAIHLDSATSQLIQMADLVAWSAYAAVEQHTPQSFAWSWYSDFLSERDPQRTPQAL